MKIAFLLQSFPCLSETFILNQITGLIDSGCSIRILAFNKPVNEKQHPDVQKYGLLDKTIYITLPKSKAGQRVQTMMKSMAACLRHPVQIYRLQRKLLENFPCYPYRTFFLALTFIRERFDLIHCHYGMVGNEAVITKDIGLKAKVSTVFHGHDLSVYLNDHGSDAYQELFKKGDVFLPVSEFWKDKLIALGCPAEKITVTHMGVNTDTFRPRKERRSPDTFKVLTAARLTEKKGHRYALQAIREALHTIPNLEYHIAGDGPLFEEMQQLTHDLSIENHVIFHGKFDSTEALQLYNNADIFLLPSVTPLKGDMEGIPVSLMEAMACGLPVIASHHSGIPELVIDGRTGYTVPERDVQSIADRITCLAGDDEQRIRLGTQARDYVKENFNNRILMGQTLAIFRNMLKTHTER